MGSLHGFSRLRRPLPLLVTSLVLSGVFCSSSGVSTLCDVTCCSVLPSCGAARLVTCDCPHLDTMTLRKGDIPETVRAVKIISTRHVTIDKDAINGLHSLTNFTLSDIAKLEIKQDGMASQNQPMLRSVTIQNVGSLHVESKAFSGVWQSKTSIRMHRIGGLYVASNALDYQVAELGPSISLQHVEMLNLEPNGLAASIFELDLYNVTMDVCHDGSFGGNTLNTELNKVTIAEARARCFYGLNDFATFNIRSLKIKTVHPQAFSGNMRELIINDSHFTTMHERGFDIRVTSMELSTSYISELRSKGLSVLASDTLRIDTVRVEYLRRNALAGLQMKRIKEEFDQPLVIRKLELIETENGSLTFSECTKVRLTDLDLMAPWPRICPTEKWTQALSGGGISGQLTPAQYQLFFQLFQRRICFEDGLRKFPISVESPRCSTRIGGGVSNQSGSDASLDDGEDTALRGNIQDASSQDSSAEEDVSPNDRNADQSNSRDRNVPSGADGTASASSASGARGASGAGATSSTPEAVPTAAPDAVNFNDNNEERKDGGLHRSNKPDVDVEVDILQTMEVTFSAKQARKVGASHESEEEAASHESEEPFSTESREEVDNDGHNGAGNDNKDMYRIPEASSLVKKVLASEPRGETRGSLVEIGPVRRPGVPNTLSVADGPAPASGGVQRVDQHRLLLCLALGAVLTLTVVLAVALLLLLLRRRGSRKPANDQPSALETLAGGLINRLLGRDDDHEESGGSQVQTGKTSGSFYSSASPSVDYHYYEPIRSDHMVPPPHPSRGDNMVPPPHPIRGDVLVPLPVGPQPQRPAQSMFLDGRSCGNHQWQGLPVSTSQIPR